MGRKDLNTEAKKGLASKKLYVKYMVSLRCKMIVKTEIENLGLDYKISPHGAFEFPNEITAEQHDLLKNSLLKCGMVLLSESESMLVDKIINTIIEIVHYSDELPKLNFTDLIDKHTISGDESLLKIFSDVKGVSVLQFIINQKIERTKELLLYDEIPLSEIAEKLNYKNKDYLLAQFKKVTGLTPIYFKRLKKERTKNTKQLSHPPNANATGKS